MDKYKRIRDAASELSAALNEQAQSGATFDVMAHAIEVTCVDDDGRRHVYSVSVRQVTEKDIC